MANRECMSATIFRREITYAGPAALKGDKDEKIFFSRFLIWYLFVRN
jgi:hypothetical protein